MQTTIVVPCYNEAQRLQPDAFLRFARCASRVQLLLVNDGSRDATLPLLESLAQACPRAIEVLDLRANMGKAEAVRQGLLQALQSAPDYVGFWDADLATPLEYIEEFRRVLNRREEIDLVLGSRLPLLGHAIQRLPSRWILSRTFAAIASRLLGLRIRDTQCGAKLFRVNEETAALFAVPFFTSWIFDVELLARMIRRRNDRAAVARSLYELPLERWDEMPGSKLKPRHFAQTLREIVRIYTRYLAPWSPAYAPPVLHPSSSTSTSHDHAAEKRAA